MSKRQYKQRDTFPSFASICEALGFDLGNYTKKRQAIRKPFTDEELAKIIDEYKRQVNLFCEKIKTGKF